METAVERDTSEDTPHSKTYLGTIELPLDKLRPFPGNPKQGNIAAIKESLDENQQYKSITVQADDPTNLHAGGTIVVGNNTYRAAHERGQKTIRCEMHKLDDEGARRINLGDNRIPELGSFDERLLAESLAELPDLKGTGYDETDLESLAKAFDPPDLDDLAAEVGEPVDEDGWPSISMRVPYTVKAAWNSHLSTHNDDAAQAMASLLGVDAY